MNAAGKAHLDYNCHHPLPVKGGYSWCSSCRKHVPDLRKATPEEIHALFKAGNGEACGIFDPDQLIIDEETQEGPSLFRILIATGLAAWLGSSDAKAQTQVVTPTEQTDSQDGQETPAACYIDSVQPAAANTDPASAKSDDPYDHFKPRKRIPLFNIGRRQVYLNSKMPFIHMRRRIIMGRYMSGSAPRF